MTSKSKIIKTIYLYVAALVSMIFLAVGTGTLLNTALKAYVFPKAEKGGFSRCNQQPPVYDLASAKNSQIATEEQKSQSQSKFPKKDSNICKDFSEASESESKDSFQSSSLPQKRRFE